MTNRPSTPTASPQDEMVEYAFLGVEPGARVPFERAGKSMSRVMIDFWSDSRRVSNQRIKKELGVTLRYPSYHEGLQAILAEA